jgi:hypothetical protein
MADPSRDTAVQRSMGFGLLAEHLRCLDRPRILDLGAPVGANLDFYSGLRAKLFVEDLAQSSALGGDPTGAAGGDVTAALQDYGDTRFHVLLAWDLFNYMEFHALTALIAHLSRYCENDALLFGLVCVRGSIAARPSRFEIRGDQALAYVLESQGRRRCPQHGIAELLRCLPQFVVVRTFLLRNGMQEYVFRYQGG